jgi:hypothetical protein
MKTIIAIFIVLLAVAAAIYYIPGNEESSVEVNNFAACLDAGYPVMESFPRQCQSPDGRTFTEETKENPDVVVDTPVWGAVVTSPLRVSGKARGNWYFEANIPVTLEDQNGKVLAQKGFQAQGEWMTTDYVPFSDTLTFTTPDTEFGRLIISKDNPSGLPEHDASFAVPVKFR